MTKKVGSVDGINEGNSEGGWDGCNEGSELGVNVGINEGSTVGEIVHAPTDTPKILVITDDKHDA